MKAYKGAGSSQFAYYDANGVLVDAYFPLGNQTSFEMTAEADTTEVTSTADDTYSQILDTDTEPKSVKVSITVNRLDNRTMAILFMGDLDAVTGLGGSVVDEPFTATLGAASRIPHTNITAFVLKDSTGITTYALNVDYTVDLETGFVTPLVGGAIVDAATVERSYTYPAGSGFVIGVNGAPSRKIALVSKFKNRFDGKRYVADILQCVIKPSKAIDMMSDKPVEATFEVIPILVPPATESVLVRIAA